MKIIFIDAWPNKMFMCQKKKISSITARTLALARQTDVKCWFSMQAKGPSPFWHWDIWILYIIKLKLVNIEFCLQRKYILWEKFPVKIYREFWQETPPSDCMCIQVATHGIINAHTTGFCVYLHGVLVNEHKIK